MALTRNPLSTPAALPGERRGVIVRTERWREMLPARLLPPGLPEASVLWRAHVFALAEAWRERKVSSGQLAMAALMWGYGPAGYGPWRARQALGATDSEQRLEAALSRLRDLEVEVSSLVAAYDAFCDPLGSRLPWLGPAFFTKVIYFAGYRRGRPGTVQPLILDRVVASRLPAAAGVCSSGGWSSVEWLAYLRWAAEQATRLGREPDEVELALFNGRFGELGGEGEPAG